MTQRERYLNTSLSKALRVLELFDNVHPEFTLTEIAEALDGRPGSIYPIVYTLRQFGYLDRDPATKRYRLGLKILMQANHLLSSLDLRDQAKPVLWQLSKELGVNTHLAVLYEDEVLYLDQEGAAPSVLAPSAVGWRAPLCCTALGKILLAYNPEVAKKVLSVEKLPAMTLHTVTNPEVLRHELTTVKKLGYALDREEFHIGNVCVATAVRNYRGTVIAAISLSMTKTRFEQDSLDLFVAAVVDGARKLSQALGYVSSDT